MTPELTKTYKLEVIAVDGLKDYDEVEVKIKEFEILNISPNPATNNVTIGYKANTANSAYLMINMAYGQSYNYILDTDMSEINIDVSSFSNGIYNIILVCNGAFGDNKNLNIQ